MRLLIHVLPYNVDYYCPCIWTVHVIRTIMYNNNTDMYHEPRHDLDYTGNTVIVELNSI